MLKSLLRIRLAALWGGIVRISKTKKKRSPLVKALIALLVLYVAAALMLQFGMLFSAVCGPLHEVGYDILYFALVGMTAFAVCFLSSIFMAYSQLFDARDNELLLSMPIPPRIILASRMLTLLITDYLIEMVILLPAAIVYGLVAPFHITRILILIVVSLFMPLLALALSALLGWFIAAVSSKVRNKSLIVTTLSVGSLLLYFYFYMNISKYAGYLIRQGAAVLDALRAALLPAYLFGAAVSQADPASFLLFCLIAVIPFIAVYLVLSLTFIRFATARPGSVRAEYRHRPVKANGAMSALIRKELTHFFANPMYILNGAIGVVFTIILPVALIVKSDLLSVMFSEIPRLESILGPFVILLLCSLTSTSVISAPSISLEGKNLWIPQSIPVDSGDILLAKAYAHMVICMPAIAFSAVVMSIILDISLAMKILVFITPLLLTMVEAVFGVAVNLRFPKFDWLSETEAIKQGVSTLIAIFGAMGLVGGAALLYIQVLEGIISPETYIFMFSVFLAFIYLLLFSYLKGKGRDVFTALGS